MDNEHECFSFIFFNVQANQLLFLNNIREDGLGQASRGIARVGSYCDVHQSQRCRLPNLGISALPNTSINFVVQGGGTR